MSASRFSVKESAAAHKGQAAAPGVLSRFAALAAANDLSAPVMPFLLAAAVFWGAVHGLGHGHGKTVVGAYLVGARGTSRHALALGLTVTATHTAGVYLLGLVTLTVSHWIVPEQFYPVLSLISGLIMIRMGLSLLATRARLEGLPCRAREPMK